MFLHALPVRRRKLKYVQIYYFIPFILHVAPNLMPLFAHIFSPYIFYTFGRAASMKPIKRKSVTVCK